MEPRRTTGDDIGSWWRLDWIFLAIVVLIGLGLRLWNLGALGLVADEGHQALAVRAILEHGYPAVESGNIYFRGAPFLYSEAAVASLGGVTESTLRFPAVLFGTLCIIATFFLTRRLFGTQVGLVASTLIAFSLWELELSRYARMYTLLQLAFVMSVYAFIRGVLDDDARWRVWMVFFMALAIVTHQLGVMVLTLFLVPAFLGEASLPAAVSGARRYRLLAVPAVLGAFWLIFHRQVGRWMIRTGVPEASEESIAPGILGIIEQHVRIPEMTMPLNLLGQDPGAVLGGLVIFAGFALAIIAVGWRQPGRRLRALAGLIIVGAAAFNLLAVVVGLTIVAVMMFGGGRREYTRQPWSLVWVGTLALITYWVVYLARNPTALDPGWGEPWTIAQVMTSYPPFKSRVLDWFLMGWPRMTMLVIAGLGGLAVAFLSDRRETRVLVALAALLLPLFAVTFGREGFNEVRYHFHLYPFMIIIFALVITLLARGIAAGLDIALAASGRSFQTKRVVEIGIIALLGVALCRDVAPGDIGLLVARDYTTSKDPIRATLNWSPYATFHQDHVGPAEFVRERLEPGDRVMFFGPTYWASIYRHYIGQVDYAVSEKAARIFRDGVVYHHVTGARCLLDTEELEATLAGERAHRIWLLGDLNLLADESAHFSPAMKEQLQDLATPWHYLGRDSNTLVRRIDPAPDDEQVSSLGETL